MMGDNTAPTIPYWQVNVPVDERPDSCPAYLLNLNEKDRRILATPDSEYHILSWPEVRSIIDRNRLDVFQRIPSELRRYFAFNYEIKQKYGSVMQFVLTHRLGWTLPIEAEAPPFKSPNDITVKQNDWPYGIDEKIVHLVVWTKFPLDEDPNSKDGDITDDIRNEIENYVDNTFRQRIGKDNVIWFKNWKSLKSIHSVEHFHVMLYDPDPEFLKEITGGDVPLSQKV